MRMEIPIPTEWKDLWGIWDLRVFILMSLSLQSFLILVAPLRRQTFSNWIIMPLWSAYLLADWAANFAVGLISSSQIDPTKSKSDHNNSDLLAFWAPFLLVHLGGPDTITAFALEDNELWLRHLLSLIFQLFSTVYVFFLSLPENNLWIPTMLMFITGIIKYAERTRSLYLASLNRFQDSMLKDPNYAKLMGEYRSKKEESLPTKRDMIAEPARKVNKVKEGKLNDTEVVLYAHQFFETFKGLIVDLIFSFSERNMSRDFFLKRSAEDAFNVIIIELSFIYDVLFTKVSVVYTKFGYSCRFVSFALVSTSLGLFYIVDKRAFEETDVGITYTLLLGALALDVIAFIKLISSDWLKVAIYKMPDLNLDGSCIQETNAEETPEKLLGFRLCWKVVRLLNRLVRLLNRRWSETAPTYNLIFYCLHRRSPMKEKIIGFFGLTAFFDRFKYARHKTFTEELRDHIFEELQRKSEMADDEETAKEVSAAKGDLVLRIEGCSKLLPYVLDVDYDQSILLWHIATDLCYYDDMSDENRKAKNKYRDFSKLLSDYMLYLLIMKPTMTSAVAGMGQIRFQDTCFEVHKLLQGASEYHPRKKAINFKAIIYGVISFPRYVFLFVVKLLSPILAVIVFLCVSIFQPLMHVTCPRASIKVGRWARDNRYCSSFVQYFASETELDDDLVKACRVILDVCKEVRPGWVKGDGNKSVLFKGCRLASELTELERLKDIEDKWKVMSRVWVEMLSYAAIRCRAHSHAQQLSKGGELITLVWLLMAHFGLGDQFQIRG